MIGKVALLELSLKPLDYYLAEEIKKEVSLGSLVKVPLREKEYYGIIIDIKKESPEKDLKTIKKLVVKDLLPKNLLNLIKIVARYYFLEISDLLNYLLPQGLVKFLEKENKIFPLKENAQENKFEKPYLFWQYPDFSLFQRFFPFIEQKVKANKSILLIFPTVEILNDYFSFFKENFNKDILLYQYHYQIKKKEQLKIWQEIREGKNCLLFSVKQGIFLPFLNLGGIFLFFEDLPIYKEWERKIHFDIRKVAFFRAYWEKIPLFLFTPFPSLELFYQILKGKVKVVKKDKNLWVNKKIVILKKEKERVLSTPLRKFLFYLKGNERCFLLTPQKSYSQIVYCEDCGYFPKCPYCQVGLNYFKNPPRFECPYCRFQTIFEKCPLCQGENFYYRLFGKEKVLEEIEKEYGDKKENIKVGNFLETLTLRPSSLAFSAILDYENLLSFFGFLGEERFFQIISYLLAKIKKNGWLFIQKNRKEEDELLKLLLKRNIKNIYNNILKKRKELFYPPFSQLLVIKVIGEKGKLLKKLKKVRKELEELLKEKLGDSEKLRILGPVKKRKRKKGKNIYQFLLKIPREIKIQKFLSLEDFKRLEKGNLQIEIDFQPIEI
uniref:Primosomal protein N n=1 Tax=candidate division WOR-3 bacterium TaxID=2052148 RepID=A0A7V5Y0I9_UNCW3